MPIIALNLIPAALIILAWVFYSRNSVILSTIRRIVFPCGLGLATIASILLLVFLRMSFLNPSSVGHVNEAAGSVLMTALLVSLVGTVLVFAGSGKERMFAIACGVSLIILLYVAGMATSI